MKEQTAIHHTFVIERNYSVTPQRVFAAFSDPAQKRRWYGRGDQHEIEQFEMDFRAGGSERLHYRFGEGSPFPGVLLTNEHLYLDIVQDTRIIMASAMAIGGKFISGTLETFEFLATEKGTTLIFTHQGAFLEGSGGPEMRQAGWEKLLDRLTVELNSHA